MLHVNIVAQPYWRPLLPISTWAPPIVSVWWRYHWLFQERRRWRWRVFVGNFGLMFSASKSLESPHALSLNQAAVRRIIQARQKTSCYRFSQWNNAKHVALFVNLKIIKKKQRKRFLKADQLIKLKYICYTSSDSWLWTWSAYRSQC